MKRMSDTEQDLIAAMERDPLDEAPKVHYEEFLREARPNSVTLELLQREREIARSFANRAKFDRLIDDYVKFMTEHYTYFWDRRGATYIFRGFSLWLVSFNEARRHAVELAITFALKNCPRLTQTASARVDLDQPPILLAQYSRGPDTARDMRDKVIDFIRRYKGPSGTEPELHPDEVKLVVAPTTVDRAGILACI